MFARFQRECKHSLICLKLREFAGLAWFLQNLLACSYVIDENTQTSNEETVLVKIIRLTYIKIIK